MDSFSSFSSQSHSSMRHYHGQSAGQRNFLGGEIDNLFKSRIPVNSVLQQKKQSSLLNGDPVVSSLANLNAQLPQLSTPSVRMEQLIERQNRNLRSHLSQKNLNDYQKKEYYNKQPNGSIEQDIRQQFSFNSVSNQKDRFSQYKMQTKDEKIKAVQEDQADSNNKLANKLHLLEEVFQKILNNTQIISFAKPEEIQQVRNILIFIQQAQLRLSSICEVSFLRIKNMKKTLIFQKTEDQTSRNTYMEDLKTFLQRFGEPKEYEKYFTDIALRASQIEQQQQQQIQSSQVNPPQSSNNNTVTDNNPQLSSPQQEAANELIPEIEGQTNSAPRLSVLRKYIYGSINWINAFVKNPINIIRCLLLALSLLFLSAYFSAPELSHQPLKYVLDWLAYNKSSKSLVITGSLWYCCIIFFGIRQLYVSVVGQLRSEQETHFWKLILNSNPILHISIIYMTDTSIIPQKFDLALWVCVYTTFSIIRGYQTLSSTELRRILTNIHEDYTNELAISSRLQRFSAIIFLINMWFCAGGIWIFSRSGWQRLILLFYEGIVLFLDTSKLIACTTKLRGHMIFYVNANTEEVTDPLFTREAFFDSLQHIVQLLHYVQLIANYLLKLDYQYILHLWLLYLVKKISASFRHLRKNFVAYRRFCSVKANLDALFPRVQEKQLSSDDLCSICHDELLIARRIQTCGHMFHIKCLFKWLNSQQNSRCPICRTEIPNLNFDVLDKSQISLLSRSIDGIMRGFIALGTFFGSRAREDLQRDDPIQRDPVDLHPQVPNQTGEEETGGSREQVFSNNINQHQDRINQILRDSEVSQLLNKLTQHVSATTKNSFMQTQERENQGEDNNHNEDDDRDEDDDEEEEEEEEKHQDNEKGQFNRNFQDHDDEEYQNRMLNQIQQWMGCSEDMNNHNNISNTTEIGQQQLQRKEDDIQLGQLKEEDIQLLKQFTEKLEREQTILMDLLLQRIECTKEELLAQPRNQLQQNSHNNPYQVTQDRDHSVDEEEEDDDGDDDNIRKINNSHEEEDFISNLPQVQKLNDNNLGRQEQREESQSEMADAQIEKEEFEETQRINIDQLDLEPSIKQNKESQDYVSDSLKDKDNQNVDLLELKSPEVTQTNKKCDDFFEQPNEKP